MRKLKWLANPVDADFANFLILDLLVTGLLTRAVVDNLKLWWMSPTEHPLLATPRTCWIFELGLRSRQLRSAFRLS